MAAQGLGAALSPLLGGVVAQHFGFPAAFLMLGGLSIGSLVIWIGLGSVLRHAGRPEASLSVAVDETSTTRR
jgi:MFS family permease